MVDIIIVYMIRGTKKQDDGEDGKKEKEKDKIFFKKYDTNIMPEKNQEMIDSFFHPYKNYTKN